MPTPFRFSLNGTQDDVADLNSLRQLLDAARGEGLAEVVLWHQDDRSLFVLTNRDLAWLMYLRFNGDAGFSSRNPNYAGDSKATIRYRLSNGQVDEYPASWAICKEDVFKAVEHFYLVGEKAPWIEWHDASRDD